MGCRRCILCSRGRKRAASPLSPLLGEVSNRSGAAGRQASRSRSCSGGGGLYSCGIAAGRVDSHRRSCSRDSVHRFVLAVVPRRTSAQLGTPTAILYGCSARVPRSSATRALGRAIHDSHRVQAVGVAAAHRRPRRLAQAKARQRRSEVFNEMHLVFLSLVLVYAPSAPKRCAGTFIDAGANNGDTLLSWYNDASCALAPKRLLPKSEPCDWRWPWWLPLDVRRQWCAEVFEPNPQYGKSLRRIKEHLQKRLGIQINVHFQTAFSTKNGNATFGLDTVHGTGSSLQLHRHALDANFKKGAGARVGANTTTVHTVDATAFLDSVGSGAPIALKLDVEGSEYDILRDLMMSGVLCRRVETLWVEFHAAEGATKGTPTRVDEVFKWMLETHNESTHALQQAWLPYKSARCVTTLLQWD